MKLTLEVSEKEADALSYWFGQACSLEHVLIIKSVDLRDILERVAREAEAQLWGLRKP